MFNVFDREHYYFSWAMLKSEPFRLIFYNKLLHVSQHGIMDKLYSSHRPFKSMESEPLEPLQMEHFYLILLGNTIGVFVSLLFFAAEMILKNKTN